MRRFKKNKVTDHPLYGTWQGMLSRCYTESNYAYPRYGGRGITVDERWHDFNNFIEDVGDRPEGCTLDRINVNGNYSKENCRWVTKKQQSRNMRTNRYFTVQGETLCLFDLAEKYGTTSTTISKRLERGLTIEQALEIPEDLILIKKG